MTPDSCFIRIGSSNKRMSEHLINKLYRERTKNSIKNISSCFFQQYPLTTHFFHNNSPFYIISYFLYKNQRIT